MLIAYTVYFTSCDRTQKMLEPVMPAIETVAPEPTEMVEPPAEPMVEIEMSVGPDVLIYTNRSYWIEPDTAALAAETTKSLLESKGIRVEITKDPAYVSNWMPQTTSDGNVNVIVLYGVLPESIYGAGNVQPDGSIAENWIETTDGDTILNHADYIAFNSDFDADKFGEDWSLEADGDTKAVGSNSVGGLQALMDTPDISLFGGGSMIVTSDGAALAPSLVSFESHRSIPLDQLQGDWFAEKVFASDTGDAQAGYADPVIVRDGSRGRIAIVHATPHHEGLRNGEVAAEIILNYLLAASM